ncbi:MAG: DNRLRE domain-containing protein [Kouleothrix sp.]|nr:DNRLRE domain-containing protein [Kouleothrix sp.]
MFHSRRLRVLLILSLTLTGLASLLNAQRSSAAIGQPLPGYVRRVRVIKTERLGVAHPAGLAFAPDANAFLLLPAATDAAANRLVQFGQLADARGTVDLGPIAADRTNLTFDGFRGRLMLYDAGASQMVTVSRGANRLLDRAARRGFAAGALGLQQPQGLAADPATGRLYLLDAAGQQLIRVTPGAQGDVDMAAALRDGRVTRVNLPALGVGRVRGLAFDPRSQHLFVLNPRSQVLYELTESGQVVTARDLAAIGMKLVDPQGMVIAPSGDQTDDPAATSLYLADSRQGDTYQRAGVVYELSLTAPIVTQALAAAPNLHASYVQTIDLSQWANPSPDPMDITYLPGPNRLLVSDSELEEYTRPYWHGGNQFESTLTGSQVKTETTFTAAPAGLVPSNFSDEPAGVAYDSVSGHWFYSDDDALKVFDVSLGADGAYGTSDDTITSFSTPLCGDNDPESIAVDTGRGHLILTDGLDSEVFDIAPGPNGVFDGCAPSGDDTSTHFDTSSMGIADPEGVEYNPDTGTIYITGASATTVVEATTGGTLLRVVDISFLNPYSPSGLAYAPSSVNPAVKNLYIADRGIDNNDDPIENDGKVFEISLDQGGPLTFPPLADTRVQDNTPTTNYGTSSTIRAYGGTTNANSYLKFVVAGVNEPIQSVKLRLYVADPSSVGGSIYQVSNDYLDGSAPWTETGLIWQNAPPISGTPLGSLGAVTLGAWVEFDVTAAVLGDGTYSFAIRSASSNAVYYNSREATANRPQLVITPSSGPSPTPTSTPLVTATPTSTPTPFVTATATSTPSPWTTVSYYPSDDARVQDNNPTTNYGTSAELRARSDTPAYTSYLKFVVSNVAGQVQSARVRLYVVDASSTAGSLYQVSNNYLDGSAPWAERVLTWQNAPAISGTPLSTPGAATLNTWVEFDVTAAVQGNGTYSFGLKSSSTNAVYYSSKEATTNQPQLVIDFVSTPGGTPTVTPTPMSGQDAVLVGAGDIAECSNIGDEITANLLDNIPGTVLALGDIVYPDGSAADYANCYEPSWGRHKARTRPAPGNHDYHAAGAAPYFDYFGANAGPYGLGYYSYNLGAWHIVSLNSEAAADSASPQVQWLRQDLADNPTSCLLAYWHKPLFSSGSVNGSSTTMRGIWDILSAAGAEVVLSGHEHSYERFAPQDSAGIADPNGIREFVVGTGGNLLYPFGTPKPNSEVRFSDSYGVLKLTLHATSYDWEFVPEVGQTFTDTGSESCSLPGTGRPTPTPTSTPISTSLPTETPTSTSLPTETPTSTSLPTETPTSTSLPTETSTSTSLPTEHADQHVAAD